MRIQVGLLWCCAGLAVFGQAQRPDVLIEDFEGTSYGAWKVEGTAFGTQPARGTLPGQMHVDGFRGSGLANSYHQGDDSTGTLTSPTFTIQRRYIAFLIGGGNRASLDLVIEGQKIRTATGPNDRPGGTERLEPAFWDVGEFAGKTAVLQVVDQVKGGWGHINVDHLVQTDRKPPGMLTACKREFVASQRYLNLPISFSGPKRRVTTMVNGRKVVQNEIQLADGTPDWWAFIDLGEWQGKSVTLSVDKLPEDSKALEQMQQSDSLKGTEPLYRESGRGQLHFSSRRGWNNDPNGLVFYQGEYHLFYQYNPYGWGWGNMHWGHAVSRDLVHWQELPYALAPDDFGPMFSGSAVVDWKNSSGLGGSNTPPLVLIYTAAGNPTVQCLAASTNGRSFSKFAENPVLKQITPGNRDPKVIWHEPTGKWVAVLYVEMPGRKHTIQFFTSPNLRKWTLASLLEGDTNPGKFLYECPDLFELAVDGDPANRKWVLMAADSAYAIGSFDGLLFKPEQSRLVGHRGRGFYAAQTFSDIPAKDGRRIQIGWFQTETRDMPFNQSMTLPLELRLTGTREGPRLTWAPVNELHTLRQRTFTLAPGLLTPESPDRLAGFEGELLEFRGDFTPGKGSELLLSIRGARISYDAGRQELRVNDHAVPAPLRAGRQQIVVYCDRTGLEVFASGGLTYVPMPFQPKTDDRRVGVSVRGGNVEVNSLQVHQLNSIWK